jgi:vitamin B12 transporter
MTTAVLLILLGVLSRLLPHPPNFVPMGAIALYAGARLSPLGRRWALAIPMAAMALSDVVIDWGSGRRWITPVRVAVYGSFALMVLAGRLAARRTSLRPRVLALLASGGAVFFFLTTNFAVWASLGTYPATSAGLALCYTMALPWFWNTLAAELAGTAALFGLDALARRERARRAAVSVLLLAALAGGAALAQLAPVSEDVVVTATAVPEEQEEVGSATTILTRQRIEENGWRTVEDALRSVPGVDVVRSGGPGAQTSVFLRGANSTHTLVLVDGVRVNSPFFPGYDFSLLSTENIERIEVVRGPFSALYGSDSIGGVVQILTRPAQAGFSGRVIGEAGNADQRELSAFVTGGSSIFSIAASGRDHRSDGDRDNDDWRERSGSLRLEGRFGSSWKVALEGAVSDGEVGLPGPIGAETADNRYRPHEERVALPVTWQSANGHTVQGLLGWAASKPEFESPGFESETDAQRLQARVSDSFSIGAHRLTAFAAWEDSTVDDASNFGVNLDGDDATIWSLGAEDSVELGRTWSVTAGVRWDEHSQFGSAWSPRATVSWRSGGWKLRGSAGTAFRAPSVGELYYPFSGNPDLDPERSFSFDVGAERELAGGRAEVSLFWNEYRDLIVYDFARFANYNVGRARTRGVELGWRQNLGSAVAIDAGYTYLDTEDLETGLPLIRRPRHAGFFGVAWRPIARLEVVPRAVFVGERDDAFALDTTQRVESPSYWRLDFQARFTAGIFAPFLRGQNLTDEEYAEADGFPAPGRRLSAGVEVRF